MRYEDRRGPLEDLTIIDCTMAYAGPYGASLLADLGARVVKVEPPGGDTFRNLAPFPADHARPGSGETGAVDYSAPFASVNRNKRSICLDLKTAADREIFLQLCEQADAVIENMRAGVMDELGVGYEVLSKRNPRIVYGAVRGYGDPRTGESPYWQWPCLDVAGQSFGGVVESTGDLFGVAIADIFPGTLMALGLLAAVMQARRTGTGDFFDVAMVDSMLTLLKTNVTSYGLTGNEPRPGARGLVPFGLFPTTDGRIAIAAPVERHWALLCEAMGRPDLKTDDRTRSNPRRAANREFTEETIAEWTGRQTKQAVVAALGGKVPVGPANTMAELFSDPHVAARSMIERFPLPGDNQDGEVQGAGSGVVAGNPIRFERSATTFHTAPPTLGAHTDDVLAEFGIVRPGKDPRPGPGTAG